MWNIAKNKDAVFASLSLLMSKISVNMPCTQFFEILIISVFMFIKSLKAFTIDSYQTDTK